jgi:hypothetical protein
MKGTGLGSWFPTLSHLFLEKPRKDGAPSFNVDRLRGSCELPAAGDSASDDKEHDADGEQDADLLP